MKKILIGVLFIIGFFITLPLMLFPFLSGKHPGYSGSQLSAEAQTLVSKSFLDLTEDWVDYHEHLLGMGTEETYVNPNMQSIWHPYQLYRYKVYLAASGITDTQHANAQFLRRLTGLLNGFPRSGKAYLLALDRVYHSDGTVNLEETEFYIANEYVEKTVAQSPNLFLPTVSIHPFREDALAALKKWHAKGVRIIKWIPNAMGFSPADPKLAAFYEQVKALDMVILTHVGIEMAVESNQAYGNPLLWRDALDKGVKVIFAHVGSLGECIDLEDTAQPKAECFDLAIRMMDDKKYQENLFADISAVVFVNRKTAVLKTLLARKDLHSRLIYGSDYPIPAINAMISTQLLARSGFLTDNVAKLLTEIYYVNPLLFDFVLKRQLKHPETGESFPVSLFYENRKI